MIDESSEGETADEEFVKMLFSCRAGDNLTTTKDDKGINQMLPSLSLTDGVIKTCHDFIISYFLLNKRNHASFMHTYIYIYVHKTGVIYIYIWTQNVSVWSISSEMITIETLFLVISELLDVTADLPSLFHTGREMTWIHRHVWIEQDWLVNITFMVQPGCVPIILFNLGFIWFCFLSW